MDIEKKKISGKELVDQMDAHQKSRWFALVEAVDVIDNYAKKKKLRFDKIALKSNAIEDYVQHNSNIIYRKMVGEEKKTI